MVLRNGSLICNICWTTLFDFDNFQKALVSNLEESDKLSQGYTYTTQTWKNIDDGENAGCNWCDFLWGDILEYRKKRRDQHLRTEEWPDEDERWKITVQFRKDKDPPHHMRLSTYIGDDHFPNTYEVHTSPDDPAAELVSGRNIIWEVSSKASFTLARECIDDCSNNHTCQSSDKTQLPTRVVDCTDPKNPKLHHSEGQEARYAALSYVWGQAQPHSTFTTNIEKYMSKIDINVLPRTIVDAITTTHSLGLRYLWTDTLCIIQDSPEDKSREISQMCDIYQRAYVTIIASCAKKAGDGFLHDRKNPVSTELPFWLPSHEMGTISVRDQERAPRTEPISQRAWCFQERLLASRALVYASHTLQFQCRRGLKNVGGGNNFLTDKKREELEIPSGNSDIAERKTWLGWKEVLAEYTRRSVTNSADKLVALSGVAQAFQRTWVNETDYVCGLWKTTLVQDLVWCRSSSSARTDRPKEYRAPSWSWAATDGLIADGGWPGRINPLIVVHHCSITPKIPNFPFGEIERGDIQLEAIVRHVSWEKPKRDSNDSPLYEMVGGKRKEVGFVYHDFADGEVNEGLAVVIGEHNKAVLHNLLGILVTPSKNVQGVHVRVGFFNVHAQILDEGWEEEPFVDIKDWIDTSRQLITVV